MRNNNSKRLVILDTELTGLAPEGGDRIASLGLIEVFDAVRIGEGREWFFHPEGRRVSEAGQKIHGLTQEFLEQHLTFTLQIDEIIKFIGNSKIAHHCWIYQGGPLSVDEKFMATEFKRAGRPVLDHARWINMKEWARRISPEKNSLNDMLDRYGIDRTARDKHHGALMDARLTADLYTKYRAAGFTF